MKIEENDDKEIVEKIRTKLDRVVSENLEQQNIGDLITLYVNALEKETEIDDNSVSVYFELGEY